MFKGRVYGVIGFMVNIFNNNPHLIFIGLITFIFIIFMGNQNVGLERKFKKIILFLKISIAIFWVTILINGFYNLPYEIKELIISIVLSVPILLLFFGIYLAFLVL